MNIFAKFPILEKIFCWQAAGALLLMRIEHGFVQDFRNAIMRYHSIVHTFNGHVIGVTEAPEVSIQNK